MEEKEKEGKGGHLAWTNFNIGVGSRVLDKNGTANDFLKVL